MKTLKNFGFVFAAAFAPMALVPAVALDHHKQDGMEGAEKNEAGTIVDVAAGNDAFTTLVAAVKAADLVETLSGEGPFTVFAPTNAAFDALPEGTVQTLLEPENKSALQMVLTYHVVAGEVKAGDLVKMIQANNGTATVKTVEGTEFTAMIKDGNVVLNDAAGNEITVVDTNIQASNGIIHVVDTVLMPTSDDES